MRRAMVGVLCVLARVHGRSAARRSRAAAQPKLDARAATLIDAGSGEQLYGRIADSRQAIASATKLMTALVTLEHVHRLGVMFTQNDYRLGRRGLADRAGRRASG